MSPVKLVFWIFISPSAELDAWFKNKTQEYSVPVFSLTPFFTLTCFTFLSLYIFPFSPFSSSALDHKRTSWERNGRAFSSLDAAPANRVCRSRGPKLFIGPPKWLTALSLQWLCYHGCYAVTGWGRLTMESLDTDNQMDLYEEQLLYWQKNKSFDPQSVSQSVRMKTWNTENTTQTCILLLGK